MTRTRALLLCSAAAILTFGTAAQAATPATADTSAALSAGSYADLLAPIPNAVALLQADDAVRVQQPRVQLAQYHHHHHHSYHHHHHHAHFPLGVFVAPRAYYGPHCYWTAGRPYWNGYRWVHPRVRVCN